MIFLLFFSFLEFIYCLSQINNSICLITVMQTLFLHLNYFLDLTPEQQKLVIELRRRKQELLLEIQVRTIKNKE